MPQPPRPLPSVLQPATDAAAPLATGPGQFPPTFDAQYVLRDASRYQRLVRDLKVLRFLAMVVIFWATKGRRIRRGYREALAAGRPFVLEEEVLPLLPGKRR